MIRHRLTVLFLVDNSQRYWIGGHERYDNRGWCWGDEHTPITLFYWVPGEPDNDRGSDERCIEMRESSRQMRWNGATCHSSHNYVCEKEAETPTILE